MRKLLRLSWVCFGMAALSGGCVSRDVTVGVTATKLGTYPSANGYVNVERFDIGDIVELDTKTQTFWKAGSVQVEQTDVTFTQPLARISESFGSALDSTFSRSVGPVLKQKVAEDVQSGTVLQAENCSTRKLKKPEFFAYSSDALTKQLTRLQADHPDDRFFLVSSVSTADKVSLASASSTNVDVVGEYRFHLNFEQNPQLTKLVGEKPAFFNLTPLTLEKTDGRRVVRVYTAPELLSHYQPAPAIASIAE